MNRYFVQRRPKTLEVGDDEYYPLDIAGHIPSVPDHEATDTGLVDAHGDPIMRAPNPIGFIW